MFSQCVSLGKLLRIAALFSLTVAGVSHAAAQTDPDPNSPTPVLISMEGTPRVLAFRSLRSKRYSLSAPAPESFAPNSRITIFVGNLDLMEGEGANAFRVHALDADGRMFRFPSLDIQPVPGYQGLYALTTQLTDEIGYWPQPEAYGDMKVYVTWRGLASNSLALGFGKSGGLEAFGKTLKPTPVSELRVKRSSGKLQPQKDLFGYKWSGDRLRFLEQATFGPTWDLDQRLRRIGLRTWIAEQFSLPYPSANNPYPNQPLKPGNAQADCNGDQNDVPDVPVTCFRDTYTMYQIQTWNMREAFYGAAQLRHRVSWALSQIWVTSGNDIQQSRHMVEWHKVLSNNAFGNYRNLMKEMTLNPTMGDYLDMVRSTKNNPNENYARELNQLFTIGLFMMNPDGTFQRDANNELIPTYDQNVINNFTKVLTGWNFCNNAVNCPNFAVGTVNFIDPVVLNTNNHDLTAKTLLSYPGSTTTDVPACPAPCTTTTERATYANNSLEQALDNIFYHPNLGPYIGRTLIQQMVTSDPSPAYVSRVTAAFNDNGNGVRGDMRAVIRAILLDPEARGDTKTDPNFGKLREPFLFATNFARIFGVRDASGTGTSDGYFTGRGEFTGMGQIPFQSPTVFNYYPPDYVIPGTSLLGPEFALMTTGTTIQRTNYINRMVFTTIPIPGGTTNSPQGTSYNFDDVVAASSADPTGNKMMDLLNQKMMHYTMSPQMRESIRVAATQNIAASNPLGRARQAIYLVATSSQFQVQR